jgi:hypothetical protein
MAEPTGQQKAEFLLRMSVWATQAMCEINGIKSYSEKKGDLVSYNKFASSWENQIKKLFDMMEGFEKYNSQKEFMMVLEEVLGFCLQVVTESRVEMRKAKPRAKSMRLIFEIAHVLEPIACMWSDRSGKIYDDCKWMDAFIEHVNNGPK